MPRVRISKRSVDELVCSAGKDRAFLWDCDLSGFGAVAFASGRKVYIVQYRQGGRSRRATLGRHGALTPEEARTSAKKFLGEVAGGADPLEMRRMERRVPSFGDVARDYLARHVAAKRKPRTLEGYETLLRLHILPVVGAMRVTDVRRWHVSKLHSGIASPGAANRALRLVSAIWNFAEREFDDLDLGRNPARGIALNRETGREKFLSADELERLGEALDRAATIGLPYNIDETKANAKHAPKPENRIRQIDPLGVAAIRLLLLTGARLREILNAKWTYIDAERGLLNLPDSKTGAKHIVLSRAALIILDGLPKFEDCEFIFPGRSGHVPRTDLKGPWSAVTQAAGLEGLRLHDLRHSFASIGASEGLGLPVIGKLLGHSTPAMTARYSHFSAQAARDAANQIGDSISDALNRRVGAKILASKR